MSDGMLTRVPGQHQLVVWMLNEGNVTHYRGKIGYVLTIDPRYVSQRENQRVSECLHLAGDRCTKNEASGSDGVELCQPAAVSMHASN